MFQVTGNFSQGAMYGGRVNGFQAMEMQRQENTDKLISEFEALIAAGYNPNTVAEDAFDKAGVKISDTAAYDKRRLQLKVEQLYQSNRSHR